MTPALSLVPDETAGRHEPLGEQVRRLQHEAKDLARAHAQCLEVAMINLVRLAEDVADGGDAYPPGVRDLARRTAADGLARAATLHAILGRA